MLLLILLIVFAGYEIFRKNAKLQAYKEQFAQGSFTQEVPEFEIYLPETIYVVEGMTMEIYNSQVTSLGDEIKRFNVRWVCDAGKNLERKFSVTGSGELEASYELSLEIYDNDLVLLKKDSCILKVVSPEGSFMETAGKISTLSEVPEQCLAQVKICVDTEYNGTLERLKPEGILQMQDVIYAVICGTKQN